MARTDRRGRPPLVTPAFVLITTVNFGYFLSIGMLLPTLPLYVDGPLGGGKVAVGFVVGAFAVTSLVMRPISGRLSDRRGRRIPILAGAILVTLSTLAFVAVESIPWLFALRLVAGVGEALYFVSAASAINDLAPDARRGEAVSLFSLALYGGLALGPLAGESLLHAFGFTEVWLASAAAAFAAALLAVRIPETRPPEIVGRAAGAMRLVHPAGLRPGTALLVSIWGFAAWNAFVPLYARDLGLSGSRFVFLLLSAIVLAIRSFGATLPDRLGLARSARTSVALSTAGLAVMGLWQSPGGLFAGTAVYAVGVALSFPALMSLAVGSAPAGERGAVVGTFTAFLDLGFGIGPVTLGPVAEAFGFDAVFLVGAAVAAVGLVVLAGIREPAPARPAPG